jgi:hypothetical protein
LRDGEVIVSNKATRQENPKSEIRNPKLKTWLLYTAGTVCALYMLLVLLLTVPQALAAGPKITLDGQFVDWVGQVNVDDPRGDSTDKSTDLRVFYFRTDLDNQINYLMAEFWEQGSEPRVLHLYVDTNDDGVYGESIDRLAEVHYEPLKDRSSVHVLLFDGDGTFLGEITSDSDWGESVNGGARRLEWALRFEQLGILPGQVVRMRLEAVRDGSVSDTVTEIQATPADALGFPLLFVVVLAGATWLTYRRRQLG